MKAIGGVDPMCRATKEGHGHILGTALAGEVIDGANDRGHAFAKHLTWLDLNLLDNTSHYPVADLPRNEDLESGFEVQEITSRLDAVRPKKPFQEQGQPPDDPVDDIHHSRRDFWSLQDPKAWLIGVAGERVSG
jgi:hypothetical protein